MSLAFIRISVYNRDINCGGLYELFKCYSNSGKMGYDSKTSTSALQRRSYSGAQRVGNVWTIPENAEKPEDARKKVINKNKHVNANISIRGVGLCQTKIRLTLSL